MSSSVYVSVETITEKRSKQRLTPFECNPKTSEWSEELLEKLLGMRRDQMHQYFKFGDSVVDSVTAVVSTTGA